MASSRSPVAILDAAVLVPGGLRDLLLSLADASVFRPVWTTQIERETLTHVVERLVAAGLAPDEARAHGVGVLRNMNEAFPDARLATRNWMPKVPLMLNDRKDRHVLAAAVGAHATHVITTNIGDFPAYSWPAGVQVLTPDTFTLGLLEQDVVRVITGLLAWSARLTSPPRSPQDLARAMQQGQFTPGFGAALEHELAHDRPDS